MKFGPVLQMSMNKSLMSNAQLQYTNIYHFEKKTGTSMQDKLRNYNISQFSKACNISPLKKEEVNLIFLRSISQMDEMLGKLPCSRSDHSYGRNFCRSQSDQ